MKSIVRFLPLALVVFMMAFGVNQSFAQLTLPKFLPKDGLAAASANAKDSLAADAVLTFVGTSGDISKVAAGASLPITIEADMATGKSTAWIYVFYSPSTQQTRMVAVVNLIISYQAFGLGSFPLPIPGSQNIVNLDASYGNSDKMVGQLKKDQTYSQYRTKYPTMQPAIMFFGDFVGGDSVQIPNGFPINEQTWTTSFIGTGDTTSMTCFVTAQSGTTYCQQFGSLSGVHDANNSVRADMVVSPNPAIGMTNINIQLPTSVTVMRGASAALYDALGNKIMDLTENFVLNNFASIQVDTRTLPTGTYYCRIAGNGWQAKSAGIVVVK